MIPTQRAAAPSPESPTRVQLKQEIAGLSYAEQVERLTPPKPIDLSGPSSESPVQHLASGAQGVADLVAQGDRANDPLAGPAASPSGSVGVVQLEDEGSAMVAAAAGNTEVAFENSFTPRLVRLITRPDNPMTVDEALEWLAAHHVTNYELHGQQHPTLAQYGQLHQGADPHSRPAKLAVLVANEHYNSAPPDGWLDVASVESETNALNTALEGLGYTSIVFPDETQDQMQTNWSVLANALNAGDEAIAYYAGHGTRRGLVGVNDQVDGQTDLFTNGQIASVVNAATDKGIHIRFIMDCCHSATSAQLVREERLNYLARNARGQEEEVLVIVAQQCMDWEEALVELVEERNQVLTNIVLAVAEHDEQEPPADATGPSGHEQWQSLRGSMVTIFRAMRSVFNDELDAQWQTVMNLIDLFSMDVTTSQATGQAVPQIPENISDYQTLADQLDYLDDLANLAMSPVDQRVSSQGL